MLSQIILALLLLRIHYQELDSGYCFVLSKDFKKIHISVQVPLLPVVAAKKAKKS